MNMENIAKQFQLGDAVKTPFGSPANNKWRRGYYAGRNKKGLGMIRVMYGNHSITISRPMDEIFPDKKSPRHGS